MAEDELTATDQPGQDTAASAETEAPAAPLSPGVDEPTQTSEPGTGEDTGDLDFGTPPPEGSPERENWEAWKAKLTAVAQEQAARKRELEDREAQLRQTGQRDDFDALPPEEQAEILRQEAERLSAQVPDEGTAFQTYTQVQLGVSPQDMTDTEQRLAYRMFRQERDAEAKAYQTKSQAFNQRVAEIVQANPGMTAEAVVNKAADVARNLGVDIRTMPNPAALLDLATLSLRGQPTRTPTPPSREQLATAESVRMRTAAIPRTGATNMEQASAGGDTMRDIYLEECRRQGIDPTLLR